MLPASTVHECNDVECQYVFPSMKEDHGSGYWTNIVAMDLGWMSLSMPKDFRVIATDGSFVPWQLENYSASVLDW